MFKTHNLVAHYFLLIASNHVLDLQGVPNKSFFKDF